MRIFFKKENNFFFINVSLHCLELVYNKNYFNLKITFVLRLFKIAKNQTKCSRLKQRSVTKVLVA